MKVLLSATIFMIFMVHHSFALFCYKCIKGTNFTCMAGKTPPQTELAICPEIPDVEKQLGASPICYKVQHSIKVGDEEKLVAKRGCIHTGGTVTVEGFCKNMTKNETDIDCQVCRSDGCNKADGIDIFMPLILIAVLINGVFLKLYGH